MKQATAAQKDMMKKFDLDKIEDMHEEMADMMAEQEEVQEVLGRDYGVGTYNESELMDELDELDADIVNEKLDNGISAPSYLPQKAPVGEQKAPVAVSSKKEADELANIMNL